MKSSMKHVGNNGSAPKTQSRKRRIAESKTNSLKKQPTIGELTFRAWQKSYENRFGRKQAD